MINFGNCSYLGLDIDPRLKEGAIKATEKFGVQFSSSRAFLSCTLYDEYEDLLERIFGHPIVITPTTTLGHQCVLPVIVEEHDLVILDQQVHASVKYATNTLKLNGIKTTIIRHNDLTQLEQILIENEDKYNKIWYLVDGIFSMYGDLAPIEKLVSLQSKYENLHLYIDDAHGMSWSGQNGKGYVLSKTILNDRMIVGTSLNKAFSAGGGVFIFPNKHYAQKVRNCGGPMIFAGPLQIPSLGAGIASAKIHLSDEITRMQQKLLHKIKLCVELGKFYNLPIISNALTPIFFLGLGINKVGYNMVDRMMQDGFWGNLGIFPAVPQSCAGFRFTITNHLHDDDIEMLISKIASNFPKALQDEGRTAQDIQRGFRKIESFQVHKKHLEESTNSSKENGLSCEIHETIENVPKRQWNALIGNKTTYDWDGMKMLEKSFSNNVDKHNNWGFYYVIIKDEFNNPVIATYLTDCISKDDMLSPANISKQIEEERTSDKYYLTSKTLMMGCMVSVGNHIYTNKKHPHWKKGLNMLLDNIRDIQETINADVLNLRDFEDIDVDIKDFLHDENGFIPVNLPNNYIIENLKWNSEEEYLNQFTKKKRKSLRQEVMRFENKFVVKFNPKATTETLEKHYQLYKNVAEKSHEISGFILPIDFFKEAMTNENWDVFELRLSDTNEIVGVGFAFLNDLNYNFTVLGIDYSFLHSHGIYKQTMWQAIKRANELEMKTINLGITADMNKRKFGAIPQTLIAYVQNKDNYNNTIIDSFANLIEMSA